MQNLKNQYYKEDSVDNINLMFSFNNHVQIFVFYKCNYAIKRLF